MLLLLMMMITAIRQRRVTADDMILGGAAAAAGVLTPFRSPFLFLLFQGRFKTEQQGFEVSVGGSGDSEPGDGAKRGVLRGFPTAAAAELRRGHSRRRRFVESDAGGDGEGRRRLLLPLQTGSRARRRSQH